LVLILPCLPFLVFIVKSYPLNPLPPDFIGGKGEDFS